MTIGQKCLYINGITWHCLSIFYAIKDIAALLNAINNFCETNKNELKHWSMYFSREQGERLNLVFIPEKLEMQCDLPLRIEQFFERFLKENPSKNMGVIPYGSILWTPYPNNSLFWNVFHIPHFLFVSQEIRNFAQATSSLIVELYDVESSYEENVASISMFLSVKLQKKQNFPLLNVTDLELAETLQSYWEYEEDELMTEWMQYANTAAWPFIIRSHLKMFS